MTSSAPPMISRRKTFPLFELVTPDDDGLECIIATSVAPHNMGEAACCLSLALKRDKLNFEQ
jgi:hypothetical protein